jgi:hypothetical protein
MYGEKYAQSPLCVYPDCKTQEKDMHVIMSNDCQHTHEPIEQRLDIIRKLIAGATNTPIGLLDTIPAWWQQRQTCPPTPSTDNDLQQLAHFDKTLGSLAIVPKSLVTFLRKQKFKDDHESQEKQLAQLVTDIQLVIGTSAHEVWKNRCNLFAKQWNKHQQEVREHQKAIHKLAQEEKQKQLANKSNHRTSRNKQKNSNNDAAAVSPLSSSLTQPITSPANTPRTNNNANQAQEWQQPRQPARVRNTLKHCDTTP